MLNYHGRWFTHSVHRTLIKVYQYSLIKQPTRGSIWDWVILNRLREFNLLALHAFGKYK